MRSLLVLGSTGSIGAQALDVVRASPGRFRVEGLAAKCSEAELAAQAREFRPRFVAVHDAAAGERLRAELGNGTRVLVGDSALEELCEVADYELALHGVVGSRGVAASWRVLERGKLLALANKESLVVAGAELVALARRTGATILPVDSELCAIYQCLRGEDLSAVRRVILTASGGPFRDRRPADLVECTPEMALRHPNWRMGPRITIGSATLMNKALEVVEVHHLFGLAKEQIHVVVHRQSIVHSMVEMIDGSVIAQLGPPDMRAPIHFCLNHPERAPSSLRGFDAGLFRSLTFEEVDRELFPALQLGFRCIDEGSDSGAVLNAADEVSVDAFLAREIRLPDIVRVNERVLDRRGGLDGSVARLLEADRLARAWARDEIAALAPDRAATPGDR
jgi:1-deoxy-D-xylulose-5-phosphate reductoisomerase